MARKKRTRSKSTNGKFTAPSRGLYANTGNGPALQPIDIGHPTYLGVIDPDTAFWSLVKKDKLADFFTAGEMLKEYRRKRDAFADEMQMLRFGLTPSAVYFNPTERCNLDCTYCYIPAEMRKHGRHMSGKKIMQALAILKKYFRSVMPRGRLPQIIFHGSEPMLNRDAMFAAIDSYKNDFRFGVQTNGTLLDDEAIDFLTGNGIGIGLSLDSHLERTSTRTRKTWDGESVYRKVLAAMDRLRGYAGFNIICTVTRENMRQLSSIVDFFHAYEVPACMLNPVRCTRQGARDIRPQDHHLAKHFLAALERTQELYRRTGRKLTVANFANVLVSIVAPTARRLMCDISPCGGGRCFFALSARGDLFPCSEFIGLREFNGGNLFRKPIAEILKTPAFNLVTGRKVEDIVPCKRCAIRHFCGSPCPAEAYEMNGGMDRTGAFCEFYEEQVRYALRVIADDQVDAYLWDGWDQDLKTTLNIMM